ncbi:MAG: hypothetical protein OEO20_10485 [Gemmatimonadota bacterium]|nr:hypothetical protein [Gemmatimonadota bacterium]MDH3368835.1 hypothetical protein [Gemmatimonadota bacterium]MDH3478720.1 hypothetical protein [Gemmatimonadota bacterium]
MKPQTKIPMLRVVARTSAALLILVGGGCELDVQNPNAPDAPRAFNDPAGLEQLLGGAFRAWVETRANYYIMALNMQADNYTASWNNAAIRYYSSVGSDCPLRCGWNNSVTAADAGLAVESSWYGYNTVLSSANDVLVAVAGGLCFDADCSADNTLTARNVAIAKMLQGMAFSGIALLYDQGFIVDETTDLSDPLALSFNTREEMRDAALAKFEAAWTEAGAQSWTTPSEWMGVGAGTSYSNERIRQVIRTMQAELIALWPRNGAENAQAAWNQVATFASQGISSPAAGFDWEFYIDEGASECGVDCVKTWGNSIGTVRVDTRLASILATNHADPWPEPAGNPCPTVSADKRVGDGSWGPADDFNGYATTAATANAGTDFACSGVVIFPPARGQYHQSNLVHVRYERLAYVGENLPTSDATGQDPLYTVQMNDLLWAEGLIRSGGSKAQAAQLINNSRVGRGGLPPLTGGESDAELLAALQYEQEIEFMGQGTTPFFNRRRIDGLIQDTPRHMPVPDKELSVLVREVYTFGGPSAPEMSVTANGKGADGTSRGRVQSVREIWEHYRALAREAARRQY